MKKEHIEAIYSAKRAIIRNKSKIIDSTARQDKKKAAELRAENEKLRRDIRKRFGVIIDE